MSDRKNALLVVLVLAVAAITGLNHYTTQQSAAYFMDVSKQETRELVRANAVSNAQALGARAFMLVQVETARSLRFEKERDEAVEIGMSLLIEKSALTQVCDDQNDYIVLLEKTLQKHKVALPKPTPAKPITPVPNPNPGPGPGPGFLPKPTDRTT